MTESNKQKFRGWAQTQSNLPIWQQPWWLDATVGNDNWDVAIATLNSEISGVLPYVTKKVAFLNVLGQPNLTQHLGPYFSESLIDSYSKECDALTQLVADLPKMDLYLQSWSTNNLNWKPLYSLGFKQTTHYTSCLNLDASIDDLYKQFHSNCKGAIKKAQNKTGLEVVVFDDFDKFWELNTEVFSRQNLTTPYSKDFAQGIYFALKDHDAGELLFAVNPAGEAIAAGLFVFDAQKTYYLMGGVSNEFRNSGGMNLLIWDAVKRAKERKSRFFDFEGSMSPSISKFFESFGTVQMQIFRVTKSRNKLIDLALLAKGI